MTKELELKLIKRKVGEWDIHYEDSLGNKIATLLRNANGKGYVLMFYVNVPNYKPTPVKSLMTGCALIKKTLISNGYVITNKFFP